MFLMCLLHCFTVDTSEECVLLLLQEWLEGWRNEKKERAGQRSALFFSLPCSLFLDSEVEVKWRVEGALAVAPFHIPSLPMGGVREREYIRERYQLSGITVFTLYFRLSVFLACKVDGVHKGGWRCQQFSFCLLFPLVCPSLLIFFCSTTAH